MRIGVPKEVYPLERRVMMLPEAVRCLTEAEHQVFVQSEAGVGVGVFDIDYTRAGAEVIADVEALYDIADLVVKLKAPSETEFSLMHRDRILFSMFHSAQNPVHVYHAGKQGLTVVEMESIRDTKKRRMIDQTDITGQAGVYYALRHSLKMPNEMRAVVLGYGSVSSGAIDACAKLGMKVTIIRREDFPYISEHLRDADLLVNGISWPKECRDEKRYLVTREDVRNAAHGMVVLDLSVDFPNPVETVRPTTYAQPYYLDEGHVHVSIYGYPGLVPITSSRIYSQQVTPLTLLIANNGGLEGIEERGDMGKAIQRAIIDPTKLGWERYRSESVSNGSRIE